MLTIDVRSLQHPHLSGVGAYVHELVNNLITVAPSEPMVFFRNAWGEIPPLPTDWLTAPRAEARSRVPNKLLNAALTLGIGPKLDAKIPAATFFCPNLNFVRLRPETRLVLTIHDLTFEIGPHWYSKKHLLAHRLMRPRTLVPRADAVIAVSHQTKADLIALYGIKPEKIHVIYPGLPSAAPAEPVILPNDTALPERFALFISTIERRKNVPGIIAAWNKIKTQPCHKDLHLVIAGAPGFGYEEVLQAAGASPFADEIHLLGYVSPGQKTALLSRAALFVYPSFYEGFGFPPLEALRVGVPVCVGVGGALTEVVGGAALIVNPYLPGEIAEGMDALLTSVALCDRLMSRAPQVLQRYDWRRSAEEHWRVLSSNGS